MSIRKGNNIIASGGLSDINLVHKTGDEIIQGHKTFTQEVYLKNPSMDIETPPSSTYIDNPIRFVDKNGNVTSTLVFRQETTNSIASRVNALKMHMAAKGGNPMANFIMGARKNDQQ